MSILPTPIERIDPIPRERNLTAAQFGAEFLSECGVFPARSSLRDHRLRRRAAA